MWRIRAHICCFGRSLFLATVGNKKVSKITHKSIEIFLKFCVVVVLLVLLLLLLMISLKPISSQGKHLHFFPEDVAVYDF